jgi:chaperonin GroES
MDKLLMTIAVSGICFKKTYFDSCSKQNRSYLVYPEHLCVNYYAKDLESAYRVTEILPFNANEVKEKVRNDQEFLDVLKEEPGFVMEELKKPVANKTQAPSADKSTPHIFLAQSTYWDLDDDGYEEPYVITVHKNSGKVVRITARWDSTGVYKNEDDEVYKIDPVHYYTDFPFIPNPDGSIYALGFGTLLGPLNISINTLTNMLIDSGTMNNLQAGFLGKGLHIQMGETGLAPGQWKVVNASGDDLQKSVFPMPTKEPSAVLFQLMNLLITSGNQLASIAEIFVGKMPGQNTPATTTQETVQQSMAVFTAIYKRVYRSLDAEFKKIYRLNALNPDIVREEGNLAGIPMEKSDYDNPDWTIMPGADPSGDAGTIRQQKMQAVGQLLQFGTVNVGEYTKMMLEMLELPDSEKLLQEPPPPPPDPKAEAMQAKAQIDQAKAQQDAQAKQQDVAIKAELAEIKKMQEQLRLMIKKQEAMLDLDTKQKTQELDMVDRASKQQFEESERQAERIHASLMRREKLLKERQKPTKKE